jgi:FkbM family methyltransferase
LISQLANRVLGLIDIRVVRKSNWDHVTAQIRNLGIMVPPDELATPSSLADREAAARGRNGYCYFGNHVGITRTHRGHKIFVDTREPEIMPRLVLFGEWDRSREQIIVGFCRPGATVIEVGANIGYHTVAMAAAIGSQGRLHAFEAIPNIFTLLDLTISINGYRDRVSLYSKAASDKEGEIELSHLLSGAHAESPRGHERGDISTVKTETVRLDKELEGHVGKVDILRIAPSGTELSVLAGARKILERSPDIKVIITWDQRRTSPDALRAFLAETSKDGFRFWKIESARILTEIAIEDMMNQTYDDVIMARHVSTAELR